MRPVLESLHLEYAWKTRPISPTNKNDTPPSDSDPIDRPFSKDLTLPLQTLLDQVVTRFVKNNLVKYAPLSLTISHPKPMVRKQAVSLHFWSPGSSALPPLP